LTNEKKQEKIISDQTKMSSMGEMIGNIAHQWRQPLSIITSSASGLQIMKEHELLNDEHFYKALNQIEANAQYLSKTIDTFKNFIKEKKEFKEVIIQDKINNALNIIDATIKNNHIKLESNFKETEPMKIRTITGELEQVIINILNNAKDAIIENNIKDPVITLELKKSKDHVILTIKDNAGGIPDNILPKIFEPYFTTKDENKGTGIGLYMSYKIITQSLRGKLYAENTDNGAVFYIELPLSQHEKVAA
jgi:C4-dicarboxylate-specific signal transduction histidine kinase